MSTTCSSEWLKKMPDKERFPRINIFAESSSNSQIMLPASNTQQRIAVESNLIREKLSLSIPPIRCEVANPHILNHSKSTTITFKSKGTKPKLSRPTGVDSNNRISSFEERRSTSSSSTKKGLHTSAVDKSEVVEGKSSQNKAFYKSFSMGQILQAANNQLSNIKSMPML